MNDALHRFLTPFWTFVSVPQYDPIKFPLKQNFTDCSTLKNFQMKQYQNFLTKALEISIANSTKMQSNLLSIRAIKMHHMTAKISINKQNISSSPRVFFSLKKPHKNHTFESKKSAEKLSLYISEPISKTTPNFRKFLIKNHSKNEQKLN